MWIFTPAGREDGEMGRKEGREKKGKMREGF